MAMAAMNMVSAGGFLGVRFHLRCPQGVASVLCKKTPIFGSRRSKLDHLTVTQPWKCFIRLLYMKMVRMQTYQRVVRRWRTPEEHAAVRALTH
jgi:hypothetical protein